jgi:hypothetical protein
MTQNQGRASDWKGPARRNSPKRYREEQADGDEELDDQYEEAQEFGDNLGQASFVGGIRSGQGNSQDGMGYGGRQQQQQPRRTNNTRTQNALLRSHDSQLRGIDEWSTKTFQVAKSSMMAEYLMNEKGRYQSQQPRQKGMPHPTGVLIHVWLGLKLIELILAHLELNAPDTSKCGEWIAFHKDPNADLAKESLQLVVVKQMKGDGQGNDRNGAVLIKLRPHMEVMEAWSPVMVVLGRIAEETHGGGMIKSQPPPGPLIRQLPR